MSLKVVNNLGTILYTIVFGKKVGKDELGNRYFISKKNPLKKWVLYKSDKNPTIIPVNWQLWLIDNDIENLPTNESSNKKYTWEKSREQNYTGTMKSYHPAKEIIKQKAKNKQKNYKNWNPN